MATTKTTKKQLELELQVLTAKNIELQAKLEELTCHHPVARALEKELQGTFRVEELPMERVAKYRKVKIFGDVSAALSAIARKYPRAKWFKKEGGVYNVYLNA